MGCGTGLLLAGRTLTIRLQFSRLIPEDHAIYTNFECAVTTFLKGLLGDRFESWNPITARANRVGFVDVVLKGPITSDDERMRLNRGMNRLLWGIRMICGTASGGGAPSSSNIEASVFHLKKDGEEPTDPDWEFEDTCNLSPKATHKATPAKRKAAAKSKAASKPKARAKR